MEQQPSKKAAFVPLYQDIIPAIIAACGAAALGCFCVLARKADFSARWTLNASLRDLALWCGGISVNTLKTKILGPLESAGFIRVDSPDRQKSLITLTVMNDIESGKSVSNVDTDKKIFAPKNKSVSKIDTGCGGFAELFPQFIVSADKMNGLPNPAGQQTLGDDGLKSTKTEKSVSKIDTDLKNSAPKNETVSKIDTVQTVSKIDTAAPLHTTPLEVNFNNNINNIYTKPEAKKNKFPTLEEVKAFFAEKKFSTDPEDFYYKNEARGWTWCDRAGKTHKIKNWKGTAYEFEKKTKLSGRPNWNNPQNTEEKLFAWYYGLVCPEVFGNDAARDSRWSLERGYFAFIAAVARDLETGKKIIQRGTEQLEKAGFSASIKAVSNRALQLKEEILKGGK